MAAKLTPKQFWEIAEQWGSMLTGGDPGACMYGFDKRGVVQSEEHRQDCLRYIKTECRKAADVNVAAGDDPADQHPQLDALVEYLKTAPVDGSLPDLDPFTRAYVQAMLFSETDELTEDGGDPLDDNYGIEHIDRDTLDMMIADCAKFQEYYGSLLTAENFVGRRDCSVAEMAGHDFCLTRNGHGAGFWDGDWSDDVASVLTEGAKSFSSFNLCIGEDGFIHGDGGTTDPERVPLPEPPAAP